MRVPKAITGLPCFKAGKDCRCWSLCLSLWLERPTSTRRRHPPTESSVSRVSPAQHSRADARASTPASTSGMTAASRCSAHPGSRSIRAGRIFVTDFGGRRVLTWPNFGALTSCVAADAVIGGGGDLSGPEAVAFDPQSGTLFVADTLAHTVKGYRKVRRRLGEVRDPRARLIRRHGLQPLQLPARPRRRPERPALRRRRFQQPRPHIQPAVHQRRGVRRQHLCAAPMAASTDRRPWR